MLLNHLKRPIINITKHGFESLAKQRVVPISSLITSSTTKPSYPTSHMMQYMSSLPNKKKIRIFEVGPRDGLQNEKTKVSLENKLEFIIRLAEANNIDVDGNTGEYSAIEAGSAVSAKIIPQLGDFKELAELIKSHPKLKNIKFSFLALNEKGVKDILTAFIDPITKEKHPALGSIGIVKSPSLSFTKKNMGAKTLEEMDARLIGMMKLIKDAGVPILAYVSTFFHCPYEGFIDLNFSTDCVKFFYENGATAIGMGDTTGHGTEKLVEQGIQLSTAKGVPVEILEAHFHDTLGNAMKNSLKAIKLGVETIHSSVGGLGGCPFAAEKAVDGKAVGNLATEDAVYTLLSLGYDVGQIDFQKLLDTASYIYNLTGKETHSKTYDYFMGMPEQKRNDEIKYMYEKALHNVADNTKFSAISR